MGPYGDYGRPIRLFETYIQWRDARLRQIQESAGDLVEADMRADFPQFLYGPVRTSLWHGYSRVAPQWSKYARIENAPDFRDRRLRGLNGLRGFGYVGDGGDYPSMRRTERPAASLIVDTYGGVYSITRQTIINDDTGDLLNRNPADMGFAAGNFVAETLVALIESNPNAPDGSAMYSSGRGNQTTNALSEDSLVDAITAMNQQRDDDNFRIRVEVAALLVQNPRMELIANRIIRSQETGSTVNWTGAAGVGSAIFDKGSVNPVAGIMPADAVVREPFMSDANDWYLFANPADVPAFALGFLNGNQNPTVMLKDPAVRLALGAGSDPYSFEFDDVSFKVRHDFGVAPVDPRGTYRGVVA